MSIYTESTSFMSFSTLSLPDPLILLSGRICMYSTFTASSTDIVPDIYLNTFLSLHLGFNSHFIFREFDLNFWSIYIKMTSNNPTIVVAPVQPQTVVVHQNTREPNACRAAIPSMHIALSVTCLIINIIFPGIGTIVAGFAVFCCANPGQSDGGKVGTFCLNFWVGILQLALALFLVGWIWAIIWGTIMVAMSAEYHNPGTLTTVTQGNAVVTTSTVINTQQPGYNQPPQQGYNPQMQPQGYGQPSGQTQPPYGAPPTYNIEEKR
nr:protein SPEC3-like [Lytechinus pictus]